MKGSIVDWQEKKQTSLVGPFQWPSVRVGIPTLAATLIIFASSMFVIIEPAPFDILALTACLLLAITGRLETINLNLLVALVVAFGLVRLATLFVAEDLFESARFFGITTYLTVCSFLYAGYIARCGPNVVRRAIWGLYTGAAFTAAVVALTRLGVLPLADIVFYANDRARGFFKDPNVLGPAAIPIAVLALAQIRQSGSIKANFMHAVMFAVATWLVFMSFSRGAWLAYIVAVMVFIGIRLLQVNGQRALGLISLTAALLGGGLAVISYSADSFGLSEFARNRFERKAYDDDRFAVQEYLLEESVENMFGHGPGQANVYGELLGASGSAAAHSTYVRIVFEYGLLGAFVFLLLILATLRTALQGVRFGNEWSWFYAAMFACIAALLVSGLAVDTLHWRHQWIVVAFVWGIAAWQKDHGSCPSFETHVDPRTPS
jgi:O-antigen ligase